MIRIISPVGIVIDDSGRVKGAAHSSCRFFFFMSKIMWGRRRLGRVKGAEVVGVGRTRRLNSRIALGKGDRAIRRGTGVSFKRME